MKTSAYCVCHYGLDFLGFAIKSVYDHVDEFVISYTPHPSHNHKSTLLPPEKESLLRDVAMSVGPKVKWTRTDAFWYEGQHRDYAKSLCKGDLVLVVDCDEIWNDTVLEQALKLAWDRYDVGKWLINFTTPWRSFSWVVTDNMWPERIHNQRNPGGPPGYIPRELGKIWHFGYATRSDLVIYKMAIHGHKSEWRPNWFEEKWKPWPPVNDVHPTCLDTWHPQPLDKRELPTVLADHPFRNLEPIP